MTVYYILLVLSDVIVIYSLIVGGISIEGISVL